MIVFPLLELSIWYNLLYESFHSLRISELPHEFYRDLWLDVDLCPLHIWARRDWSVRISGRRNIELVCLTCSFQLLWICEY